MRRASGAEVSSTKRLSPRLNLRRSTRVDRLRTWVSVLRHSQKSGDLRGGWSVGVGTPTPGPAVPKGILKEWLWPSATGWSL